MSFISRLALIKELSDVGVGYEAHTLKKLTLSAEPVEYNATSANVTLTAITDGTDSHGRELTYVKEVYTSTEAITSQNTSSSDRAITVTRTYTYTDEESVQHTETVTGTIIQHGMPFHIIYHINIPEGGITTGVTIYNSGIVPSQLWINGNVATVGNTQDLQEGDNLIQVAFSTNEIPASFLSGLTNINSVTITDLTTSVSSQALKNCTGITSLVLGSSLQTIGSEAFYGCTGITSINIPSSLATSNTGAFSECSNLIQVYYDGTVDEWCAISFTAASANPLSSGHNLYVNGSLIRFLSVNALAIGDYAFSGATCLRSVEIGNSVTQIKTGAFLNCTNITSINMGSSVVTYWASCFKGCTGITSLSLSDATLTIQASAFESCTSLSSIVLPSKVATLGSNVFESCTRLAKIRSLNLTAATTESNTFGSINLAGSSVSNKVLEVLNGADGYNSGAWANSLCNVTECNFVKKSIPYVKCTYNIGANDVGTDIRVLGSSLDISAIDTLLLEYTSGGSTVIRRLDFPTGGLYQFSVEGTNTITVVFSGYENTPTVPANAFASIEATKVEVGEGITSVGNNSFYQAEITEFKTNTGLTSLGGGALSSCPNLATVNLAEGLTTIGSDCFYNNQSLTTITIPASVTSIGSDALSGCNNLTEIVVTDGNTVYRNNSGDGVLFSGTTLVQFPGGKTGDANFSYEVPSDITTLGRRCFAGNTKIKIVDLSSSLITSVADYVFNNCSALTTVVFRNAITSIGNWAFNECSSLNNVTLPTSLTSIAGYAFYKCTSLTSITIPATLTSMGTYAFASCTSLSTVVWNATSCTTGVSGSTSSLTGAPFSGCPLTSFTFADTVTAIPAGICYAQNNASLRIKMPSSAQSIGQYAFYGYTRGFENVTGSTSMFPSGIVNIGGYAFNGCVLPTVVDLPSTLVNIGTYAFNGCSGVTTMTVPTTINSVGIRGFASMSALTSITFNKITPPTIEIETFAGRNNSLVIYVPSGSVTDYQTAPIWTQYASIIQAIQSI